MTNFSEIDIFSITIHGSAILQAGHTDELEKILTVLTQGPANVAAIKQRLWDLLDDEDVGENAMFILRAIRQTDRTIYRGITASAIAHSETRYAKM